MIPRGGWLTVAAIGEAKISVRQNAVLAASACTLLCALAGCGGGGGGGGGSAGGGGGGGVQSLSYSGKTSAATVSATNSSQLASDVVGGSAATSTGGLAAVTVSGPAVPTSSLHPGVDTLAHRLMQASRAREFYARDHSPALAGAVPIDETDACDSGSVRVSGTLNNDGTGTISVTFNNCRTGSDTLNGTASLRIDAFDLSASMITDLTLSYTRVSFSGPGLSADLSGSLRAQENISTNTETLTENFVTLDNATKLMTKTENLISVNVYDSIFSPTSASESLTGRVFDSTHGYVDITTLTPLVFGTLQQPYPDSGELLLAGAMGAKVRVIARSANLVRLALDADGDGVFENVASMKWLDLAGPIGADLRDSDHDGMHDSWERAYGLDPNSAADAALDMDGDGASNKSEYLAGTDPTSAGSVPAGVLGPYTLASGLATANSDSGKPGQHAVGSDGTNFLLVYRQQIDIPSQVGLFKWTARLVPALGGAPAPFDLQAANDDFAGAAAVASDGANYLAVTNVLGDLKAQRISAAGALIDAAPGLTISPSAWNPAVAFGGGVYLVVYLKTTNRANVWGVLVQPSGIVGTEFAIHTGTGIQATPSVAFDGANFLIAWEHHDFDATPETADIFGSRVSPAGALLSGTFPVSTAAEAQNYPRVACDGVNCLVIWTDRRNYPGQSYNFEPGPGDMYATRISAANALLDGTAGFAIATGITANAGYPALGYDGVEYVVAWSRGAFINNPGGPTGIYSARVGKNGSVNLGGTSTGVAVSGPPEAVARLFFPAMVRGGDGTLVTWLNNREGGGTTKAISGALLYSLGP